MIKTEKLTKVYPSGTKAIDGVTFEVMEGEIFGFLGQNGAGKSTTIKILTTLARPSSGMAWINGHSILQDPVAVRKSIGYVAQESGVDYLMTGRENLHLQGRLYRMDGRLIRQRVGELLELFGLNGEADQLVSNYSGGMKRKLDIATALIHRPKILFLDEPTLGLDPHSRTNLWEHIRILNRDLNVTLFLTTHYLDEADKLSHRIGILHRGAIKIIDTPEALKNSIRGDSVNFSFEPAHKDSAMAVLSTHPLVKEVLSEGDHVRAYVDRGSEAIPVLMSALSGQGLSAESVTLSRPTLDDVYLKHSGVSFKEAAGSEEANPWWAKWQKGGWSGKKWGKASGSIDGEETKPASDTAADGSASETAVTESAWGDGSGSTSPEWEKDWKKWNPGAAVTAAPASLEKDSVVAGEDTQSVDDKPAEWAKWQGQWEKKG